MAVKEKIKKLLEELNKGLYEREDELRLALLSSIAGESIFLLGLPGVAKSLVARKLKFAYKDAKVFEYLMNRFSTPDEIFGPVSISELKKDKYVRKIDDYLPAAEVIFLDEIWKAGPSIQNSLLTVINEKIFRNGDTEIKVPMKGLISASNELPAKEQGLEALWDRFLVRLVVKSIEDKENFNKMISEKLNAYEDSVEENNKIKDDEYKKWNEKIDDIIVPENVLNVIHHIRSYINEYNEKQKDEENKIYVSDRRWRKIVRLLRASAFLNDRKEVDLMDCFLIRHCIWNEEFQQDSVYQFVRDAIEKYGYTFEIDFKGIKKDIREFQEEIKEETKFVKDTRKTILVDNDGFYELINPPSSDDCYIRKEIFKQLTNEKQDTYLYHHRYSYYRENRRYQIRKGKDGFHISINGIDYQLKTRIQGNERILTRKPSPKLAEIWDNDVKEFLQRTDDMRKQIEEYRSINSKPLRENLFVNPELGNIVESHITEIIKKIDMIEVDIKKIQNDYKNLKDEEIVS